MARTDYTDEAKSLFIEIAEKHELNYHFDEKAPVELLMEISAQPGLSLDLSMCLQNWDELWLWVDTGSFCMFPFDEKHDRYRQGVDGFISGNGRIVKKVQGPWNWQRGALLQIKTEKGWERVASGGNMFRMPFLSQSEVIVVNEEAHLKQNR